MNKKRWSGVAAVVAASVSLSTAGMVAGSAPPDGTGAGADASLADPGSELAVAAAEEGSLTWYSTIPAEPAQAILDAFGETYGLDVELVQLAPGPLVETFLADYSRGDVKADVVFFSSIVDLYATRDVGALDEYVPNEAAALQDDVRDLGAPFGIPLYVSVDSWVFRSDLDEDLKELFRAGDWSMFADPEVRDALRGQVGGGDPVVAGGPANAAMTLYNEWGEERYLQWLDEFRDMDPVLFPSQVPLHEALVSGEIVAALGAQSFAIGQIAEGAPLETVVFDPSPGYAVFNAVAADAPHPSAARLFQEWILSEAGQGVLAAEYDASSVREGWVDDRAQTTQDWYDASSPAQDLQRIVVAPESLWTDVDREEFLSMWQEAMGR